MTITKAKRSVHPSKATRRGGKPTRRNDRRAFNPERTWFPDARGKVVKQVEFFADSSANTLELAFEDDTSLSFEFQPSFVWEAYFARWKSGEQRILHRWRSRPQA